MKLKDKILCVITALAFIAFSVCVISIDNAETIEEIRVYVGVILGTLAWIYVFMYANCR